MGDNQNDLGGKVGLDVSGFKAGVTELNRQIRVIDSGFKAAAAGMEDWGSNADGLKARISSLNQITDLQRTKVANLTQEYKKIVAEKGADSKAAQDMQVWINKETAALSKNEIELRQNIKALDSLGKETDDAAKKSEKLHAALGKLKGVGAAIGKATIASIAAVGTAATAAVAGAFKLADRASDLAEAQNVISATFDESAESVLAWSKTVADTAGISETNAVKYAGSMGAMLKSSGLSEDAARDMAEGLVQLTGDMSSFYNLDNDTAWEKLRAGIAGETEPLKALGINMSVANMEAFALTKGINKSWKEMSQAEQTTLRYQFLMGATADAQGDFGKTLETSFPNQMRVAQMQMESMATSVGQKFLPAFLDIFKAINQGFKTGEWSSVGTAISAGLNQVIGQVSQMVTTASPMIATLLSGIVGAIVTAIPTLLPALTDAAMQLLTLLVDILKTNGPLLITAGLDAIMMLVDGLTQALPQLTDAAIAIILALVLGLTDRLPQLVESAIKMTVAIVNGLIKALPELIKAAPRIIKSLVDALIDNLPLLVDASITLVVELAKAIVQNLPLLAKAAVEIIGSLVKALIGGIPQILGIIPQLFSEMVKGFAAINWGKLGAAIIDGIKNGVKNAAKGLADSVVNAANSAVSGVKEFLGIRSPSRVMRDEVGSMIGAGMAQGITRSTKQVQAAMGGLTEQMTTAGPAAYSAGGGIAGAGGTQTILVNVPLTLDGHPLTTATSRIQLGQNRARARALGVAVR
jgi:hypothetical protein